MFYPKRLFSISGQISRLNLKWLMFFFYSGQILGLFLYNLCFELFIRPKNCQAQFFHLRTDIDIIQPTMNIGTDI